MNDPNSKDLIYYGTEFKFIEELDRCGLKSPRFRKEQYISVSISGYKSEIKCEHPELKEFARVYCDELQIADLIDGCLHYKDGYTNSITCVEGFGPNPNLYYNSFYGLVSNSTKREVVTAVISEKASRYLVIPDPVNEFEYLSLSLHSFIEQILPEYIVGWIVPEDKVDEINNRINKGFMEKRQVWAVNQFESFNYDLEHLSRYGFFLNNLQMYLQALSKNNIYTQSSKNHLKNILQHLISDELLWDKNFTEIYDYLKDWFEVNRYKIVWNYLNYRFDWNCGL